MKFNFSNTPPLRFVSTEIPFYGRFIDIKPLNVQGHYKTVIETVLERINWNYEGMLTSNIMDFGEVLGPGKGTGTLGYLVRNESDVGFSLVQPTPTDCEYLDYTNVMEQDEWNIVSSSRATYVKSTAMALASIYSTKMWLVCGICICCLPVIWTLLLFGFSNIQRLISKKSKCSALFDNTLMTLAIGLGQGVSLPHSRFGWLRLLVLLWIFSTWLIASVFKNLILSKLTLPPDLIRVEELVNFFYYPDTEILLLRNTPFERFLKDSHVDTERDILDRMKQSNSIRNLDTINFVEVYEKIRLKDVMTVFSKLYLLETLRYLMDCHKHGEPLYISKNYVFNVQINFPMRKDLGYPYAHIFKYTTQRLFETGIILPSLPLEIWKGRVCFTNAEEANDSQEPKPLAFVSFVMAFQFFFTGVGLSLLSFLLLELPAEFIENKYFSKKFEQT